MGNDWENTSCKIRGYCNNSCLWHFNKPLWIKYGLTMCTEKRLTSDHSHDLVCDFLERHPYYQAKFLAEEYPDGHYYNVLRLAEAALKQIRGDV